MGKIVTQCPSCESTKLQVVKIECGECQTKFEGKFDIPELLKLSEEDLNFILDFVRCSGSLKEMAVKQNVSYPTLRNRLNALIELIENLKMGSPKSNSHVLQQLEEGKINAKQAAKLLKQLGVQYG